MFLRFFRSDFYVKIYKNKIVINNLTNNLPAQMFMPDVPFTTTRLLVGKFSSAEACLTQALKTTNSSIWFSKGKRLLIQPMELVEGGLSEVEERVFRELGLGAGAIKIVLWIGAELANDKAIQMLNGK